MEALFNIKSNLDYSQDIKPPTKTDWEETQSFQDTIREVERPREEEVREKPRSEKEPSNQEVTERKPVEDEVQNEPKAEENRNNKDEEAKPAKEEEAPKEERSQSEPREEPKAKTEYKEDGKQVVKEQTHQAVKQNILNMVTEMKGQAAQQSLDGKAQLIQTVQPQDKPANENTPLSNPKVETGPALQTTTQTVKQNQDDSMLNLGKDLQVQDKPKTDKEFTLFNKVETKEEIKVPEALKKIPALEDKVLTQIQEQLPKIKHTGKISLTPKELGDLQVKMEMKNGEPRIQLTPSEGFVRNILQENFQEVKQMVQATGTNNENAVVAVADATTDQSGQFSQFSTESTRTGKVISGMKIDMTSAKAETQISQKYGIKDLQKHVLDQIRMNVDKSGKEVKIQLRPPELGEIKIHMFMEDQKLAVRMEVGEQLVRNILERDLQQLKAALNEAGIDMDSFDIESKNDRPNKNQGGFFNRAQNGPGQGENSERLESLNAARTKTGAVEMNPQEAGVDYLVY